MLSRVARCEEVEGITVVTNSSSPGAVDRSIVVPSVDWVSHTGLQPNRRSGGLLLVRGPSPRAATDGVARGRRAVAHVTGVSSTPVTSWLGSCTA